MTALHGRFTRAQTLIEHGEITNNINPGLTVRNSSVPMETASCHFEIYYFFKRSHADFFFTIVEWKVFVCLLDN